MNLLCSPGRPQAYNPHRSGSVFSTTEKRRVLPLFTRPLILLRKTLSSLPKTPPPNINTLGIGFELVDLGVCSTAQCSPQSNTAPFPQSRRSLPRWAESRQEKSFLIAFQDTLLHCSNVVWHAGGSEASCLLSPAGHLCLQTLAGH